jgi:hypothetical protein
MPGYLQGIYLNLKNNPSASACGGQGIPKFEISKPEWFDHFREAYAVGPQDQNCENGRLINLYGAGMGIKKKVWEELYQCGFRTITTGRTGKTLSSADDTELTYAMVIRGFNLIYDEKLTFFHFLPKERLQYGYIEKLMAGFGIDGPIRNLYHSYICDSGIRKMVKNWYFHLGLCLFRMIKYLVSPPKINARKIYWKWNLNYLKSLLDIKGSYSLYKQNIEKLIHEEGQEIFIHPVTSQTVA